MWRLIEAEIWRDGGSYSAVITDGAQSLALAQAAGDLFGTGGVVRPGDAAPVALQIDRVRP